MRHLRLLNRPGELSHSNPAGLASPMREETSNRDNSAAKGSRNIEGRIRRLVSRPCSGLQADCSHSGYELLAELALDGVGDYDQSQPGSVARKRLELFHANH